MLLLRMFLRRTNCIGVWIACFGAHARVVRIPEAEVGRSVRRRFRSTALRSDQYVFPYFEGEIEQNPKARRGYSRSWRPDCVQLVIALVVTPDGFPLAYEVMNGNTAESSTLRDFLAKVETVYGKARRVWVMDRGIPSEAVLKEMRAPERQTFYLVGTPKGRINQHEKKWLDLPWQKVRDSVEVKLYEHEGELYVLAKSGGRQAKENALRRKRLARLLRKLRAMRRNLPKRDQLLMRIGAAKKEAGRAFGFVKIQLPGEE